MLTPISKYPACLLEELARYGQKPTGDLEWDKCVYDTLRRRASDDARYSAMQLSNVIREADTQRADEQKAFPDLSDPALFDLHYRLFLRIANTVVIRPQRRPFIVDDHNERVIRFLLYYFNNCRLAESVFPDRAYKLHKNIMLQGPLGVGKTMIMQCFSEYLRRISSPRAFHNLSVTQMVNYYTIHSNLDLYTFNEQDSVGFRPQPENICLNDVGLNDDKVFFGTNTAILTDEFLLARNDIWAAYDKFAHVTTNLDGKALVKRFSQYDRYGRIIDRFKTYNVIPMTGDSRR